MSTRFIKATDKVNGEVLQGFDSDSPLTLVKEIVRLTGEFKPEDWEFELLNYKMELIGVWDWKSAYIGTTLLEISQLLEEK